MPTKRWVKQGKKRLDVPGPGEQRPVSIERWQRHRKTLLSWEHEGHRPVEWWIYEKNMAPPDNEEAALFAMGELSSNAIQSSNR